MGDIQPIREIRKDVIDLMTGHRNDKDHEHGDEANDKHALNDE